MGDVFGRLIGNQQIIKFGIGLPCNKNHCGNQCKSENQINGIGKKTKEDNIDAQAKIGGKGIVKIPSF